MAVSTGYRILALVIASLLVSSASIAVEPPTEFPHASQWIAVTPPSSATMYTIDLSSPTQGWTGGMAGFMFHYSGGAWAGESTGFDSPVQGIDMLSDTSGWGVTFHGKIIRYAGSGWSVVGTPVSTSLDDVSMVNENEGFAVGGPDATGHGAIVRYHNGTWAAIASPSTYWLRGVDMLSESDGFAVGIGGTVLRWNGSSWQGGSVAAGAGLLDVDAVSGSDVWAVGMGGAIWHFDGTNWTAAASPTAANLNAVKMLSVTDGWAVGDSGTILRFRNGSWSTADSPTTKSLYGLAFASSTAGWATGKDGVLLYYDPAAADLSTSRKAVNLHNAQPGERLTYTISLANTGDLDAPSVIVTDPMPAATLYLGGSAHTTQGTVQEPSGGNPLLVNVGTLAPGGSATITFQVDVGSTGQPCWFVRNEASISFGGEPPFARSAATTIGTCFTSYAPAIMRTH